MRAKVITSRTRSFLLISVHSILPCMCWLHWDAIWTDDVFQVSSLKRWVQGVWASAAEHSGCNKLVATIFVCTEHEWNSSRFQMCYQNGLLLVTLWTEKWAMLCKWALWGEMFCQTASAFFGYVVEAVWGKIICIALDGRKGTNTAYSLGHLQRELDPHKDSVSLITSSIWWLSC